MIRQVIIGDCIMAARQNLAHAENGFAGFRNRLMQLILGTDSQYLLIWRETPPDDIVQAWTTSGVIGRTLRRKILTRKI